MRNRNKEESKVPKGPQINNNQETEETLLRDTLKGANLDFIAPQNFRCSSCFETKSEAPGAYWANSWYCDKCVHDVPSMIIEGYPFEP